MLVCCPTHGAPAAVLFDRDGTLVADVEAAAAAGATPVLAVPTPVTRPEEVAAAPVVQPDLVAAVRHLLAGAT